MAELVLAVMLLSAALYAVLGGADFGAGLIEPFVEPEERARIEVAIAPVWEANHVWLVLLATLAFVAFPPVYAAVTATLHLPILGALLGIVARGTAFTFRHYDPSPGALARPYTLAFRLGSLLAPLCLGLVLAATAAGALTLAPGGSFYDTYVAPWNRPFCWATGLFACALFAFEGAALLAAEHPSGQGALPYLRLARSAHLLAIALGALVLASAYFEQLPWLTQLLGSPWALVALLTATLLIPLVAHAFRHGRPWLLRTSVGLQVTSILVGFFAGQYPVLVRLRSGDLTVVTAVAPARTLELLTWAIVVGLSLIVPGLVYLIRVYKLAR